MAVTEHGVKIVAELDTSKVQAQLGGGGSGGGGSGGGLASTALNAAIVASIVSIKKLSSNIDGASKDLNRLSDAFKKLPMLFDQIAKRINAMFEMQMRQYVRHSLVDIAGAARIQGLNGAQAASLAAGMGPGEIASLYGLRDVTGAGGFTKNLSSGLGPPLWVQNMQSLYQRMNAGFQKSPLAQLMNWLETAQSGNGGVGRAKILSGSLLFGHLGGDLAEQLKQVYEEGTPGHAIGAAASSIGNVATSTMLGFAINPALGVIAGLTSAFTEVLKTVRAFDEALKTVSKSLDKGISIQEDAVFKQGLKSKGTDFLDKEWDKAQKSLEYYNKARDEAFRQLQQSTSSTSKLNAFDRAAAAKSWTGLMERYQKEADKQQNKLDAIEKRRKELDELDNEGWWIENQGSAQAHEWEVAERIREENKAKKKAEQDAKKAELEAKRKAIEDEHYAHFGEMRSIRIQGEAAREQVAQALLKGNPAQWAGIYKLEQKYGKQKLSSFDLMNELEEKLLQERDTDKRRELANRLSEEQAKYSTAESILKMIPVEKQIEWLGLGNMTSLAAKGGMMGEKDNTARMWNKLEKIVDELDSIRMNTADQRWSTFR